jgi:hypothetical protein
MPFLPFLIELTTKNKGSATAPRSMTAITLHQGSSEFHKFVKVPSLAPGKEFTKSVTIDPYQPPLGIIKTVAQADYNHGGAELPGAEIVIIARRWDVTTFRTHTTTSGQQTSDTSADSFPSMSPTATTLSGSFSPTTATKLTWDFTADVP